MPVWFVVPLILIAVVVLYDLVQRRHAILRNFPVVGHFRYLLEKVGPELRQYIVTSSTEERPFDRDQRSWVYASSKGEPNTFGFGSDREMENTESYLIIKPSPFPLPPAADPTAGQEGGKVLGGAHGRKQAFRPASWVNISGMSYGALSARAVEALNRGAALAGCLHNTGEGGLAPAHLNGGDLIFQIGTGYYGCRDEQGRFDLQRLLERIDGAPVRALEIKLSQGAKPGLGGHLPAAKVTPEIAAIRGVPVGVDCIAPGYHTAFSGIDGLLEFVETLADATGLPVGIKSAVGDEAFWRQLAARMQQTGTGVDFITIDGGEGGTGAAPLAFTNSVAMPFKLGFARVYRAFAELDMQDDVVFIGSGKLGFPEQTLFAFALGCDMINVGREALLSIGCIQAQRCHTGRCPSGVATQNKWLIRGLDPTLKSVRAANYIAALRTEVDALCRASGVDHPSLVSPDQLEIVSDRFRSTSVREVFGYRPGWGGGEREARS